MKIKNVSLATPQKKSLRPVKVPAFATVDTEVAWPLPVTEYKHAQKRNSDTVRKEGSGRV
jgi:hypothetical protein